MQTYHLFRESENLVWMLLAAGMLVRLAISGKGRISAFFRALHEISNPLLEIKAQMWF